MMHENCMWCRPQTSDEGEGDGELKNSPVVAQSRLLSSVRRISSVRLVFLLWAVNHPNTPLFISTTTNAKST